MNKLIQLQPGDTIDVIAPAGGFAPDVLPAIKTFIESWGFKAHIPDEIVGTDLVCANTDEIRFKLLKDSLTSDRAKALWCVRGGYGTTRLIPMLEQMSKPKHEKLLIGFSDITALHTYFAQAWGWATIHGPGARQTATQQIDIASIQALKSILVQHQLPLFNLQPFNKAAKQTKTINSRITGGNLTLIECSIGTNWQLSTEGKIILLEDINSAPYQVDRSLVHLQQAGLFAQAETVLLGDFLASETEQEQPKMQQVLQRFAESLAIPVLRVADVGHGKANQTVPFNLPATLSLGMQPALYF